MNLQIEDVTIVVIPRERFSVARESLESLYAHTPPGFALVYVDGHAPPSLRGWLDQAQQERGFRIVECERYLSNNEARNLGLAEVMTPLAVVLDNDLIFAPGWLEALLCCANQTDADVVAPLICEGYPAHTTIHYAGGEYAPPEQLQQFHAEPGPRELREQQYLLKEPLERWRATLQRGPTGFCEPHCILLRTRLLAKLGDEPFDERMLATKEHLDFCMSVREAGGTIWFEPASMVTFMLPNDEHPLRVSDLPFYFLRWSDAWQHRSLDHFAQKWRLGRTDFRRRYLGSGYRREDWLRSVLRRLPLAGNSPGFVELAIRGLRRPEKFLNRRYAEWYARRYGLAEPEAAALTPFHGQVLRGAAWAFASTWARLAISLVAFAIIARLIGPAAYGVNAAGAALLALCQVFVGPAMGETLIQRRDSTPGLVAAWFWLLQTLGLLLLGALYLLREPLATLFGAPQAAPLIAFYGLCLPLTALQTVPEALMSRKLQFRAQALAGGAGVALGSAVGVVLALRGAGPWSLAALQVVQASVQAAVFWSVSGWRPVAAPDWSGLRPLLRYSGGSVGVRLLNEFDNQLPRLLIGSLLGLTLLGYYAAARRIFDMLKDLLIVPLNMVALPSLVKARAAGENVSGLFEGALRVSTAIANPAFLGLAAIAPLLLPLLFGPGWQDAVPVLQLLCLLGLRSAVNSFNGAVLRGYGRPLQQVAVSALGVALLAVLLPLAAPWGLLAVAAVVVLRSYATWPLMAWLVQRVGVLPAWRQFTVGLHSLAAALLMALLVSLLLWLLDDALAPPALLPLAIGFGAASYLLLMARSAPAEFREMAGKLRQLLSREHSLPA